MHKIYCNDRGTVILPCSQRNVSLPLIRKVCLGKRWVFGGRWHNFSISLIVFKHHLTLWNYFLIVFAIHKDWIHVGSLGKGKQQTRKKLAVCSVHECCLTFLFHLAFQFIAFGIRSAGWLIDFDVSGMTVCRGIKFPLIGLTLINALQWIIHRRKCCCIPKWVSIRASPVKRGTKIPRRDLPFHHARKSLACK